MIIHFSASNLLTILKYILPLTIIFDAAVSLFLLRKSFHNALVRLFFFSLVALVLWEICFWFGNFTNYSLLMNRLVDRGAFVFGLIAQASVMLFLVRYANIKISSTTQRLVSVSLVILGCLVVLFGIGDRVYLGNGTYSYGQNFEIPATFILITYYIISVGMTVVSVYAAIRLVHDGLSLLETAKRRLIRDSFILSIVITIVPIVAIPLLSILTGNNTDAIDWLIVLKVISGICSSIWTATTAYAITRYRLFDIRVVIKRNLLQIGIIVLLTAAVAGVSGLIYVLAGHNLLALFVVMAAGVAAAQYLAVRLFQTHFTTPEINFAAPEGFDLHTNGDTTQQLITQLRTKLQTEFDITQCTIMLFNWREQIYQSVDETQAVQLSPQHGLVYFMRTCPQVLIAAQLQTTPDGHTMTTLLRDEIQHWLRQHHFGSVIPLSADTDVYGFIFLPKAVLPADDYSVQAQQTLLRLGRAFGTLLQQVFTYQALTQQYKGV